MSGVLVASVAENCRGRQRVFRCPNRGRWSVNFVNFVGVFFCDDAVLGNVNISIN